MSAGSLPEPLLASLRAGQPATLTGPFESLVGYRARLDPEGSLRLELEVEERHLNQYGSAHGGVTLTLLDSAGGLGCLVGVPGLERVATISLAANFVRGVAPGLVVARAQLDAVGATVAYATVRLQAGDAGAALLATATGAFRLFRRRQAPEPHAPAAG